MANDIILEARGLTKEFKGFVAVNGVNLAIEQGTIHALIGPNGAGKTTCFNLLTHFLIPTRGQIFFKGREITGSRPAAIARQGLVRSFQISAVFPHLSVLENVRIALQRKRGNSLDFWRSERVLREHDARARELVDAVGLGQFEQTPAGGHTIEVKMTLTAPGCGMGPVIAEDAQHKIAALPTVESAKVHIVWDPQWTPQMISAEGRKILGLE